MAWAVLNWPGLARLRRIPEVSVHEGRSTPGYPLGAKGARINGDLNLCPGDRRNAPVSPHTGQRYRRGFSAVITVGRRSNKPVQYDEARQPCRSSVGWLPSAVSRTGDPAATELAGWHLKTQSAPDDPRVIAAYDQLAAQTDRLFQLLTDCPSPCCIKVTFTFLRQPYKSDDELIAAVINDKRLEVSVAASDRHRLHPVLDCRPGGPYDRFRAVHDIVGHAIGHRGFDAEGEYSAWLYQDSLYGGLARLALATELRAEHAVLRETGEFAEHKALLAPRTFVSHDVQGHAGREGSSGARAESTIDEGKAGRVSEHQDDRFRASECSSPHHGQPRRDDDNDHKYERDIADMHRLA